MIRGIRGATTVKQNNGNEMIEATEELLRELIRTNHLKAVDVASVIMTVTEDINAEFPAKALRKVEGWNYVPVMCMKEIPVPNSLQKCIRVMMTVNTEIEQEKIQHVFLEDAVHLRPDLALTNKGKV